MKDIERNDYVKYRIETSRKTFDAAKILFDNKFYNSVVNRLYYAAFYAVNALLVKFKINSKSHSGTKSNFSLYFIKTKKLDIKYGKLFADLFDLRQKGDYVDYIDFKKEDIEPLFKLCFELINEIEKLILMDIKSQ